MQILPYTHISKLLSVFKLYYFWLTPVVWSCYMSKLGHFRLLKAFMITKWANENMKVETILFVYFACLASCVHIHGFSGFSTYYCILVRGHCALCTMNSTVFRSHTQMWMLHLKRILKLIVLLISFELCIPCALIGQVGWVRIFCWKKMRTCYLSDNGDGSPDFVCAWQRVQLLNVGSSGGSKDECSDKSQWLSFAFAGL